MSYFTNFIRVGILSMIALGTAAQAEECNWSHAGFTGSTSSGEWAIYYSCVSGSSTLAAKSVTVKKKGNPICDISVAQGYENSGTCFTPNISQPPSCVAGSSINIGMSCTNSYCAEAFGRTCYSYGGSAQWNGSKYVCRATCN